MGFRNLFRKPTKKEVKKKQVRNNAEQGLSGEKQIVARYRLNGWKMTRTGIGSDYRATRKNPHTGKAEYKIVEIKSGNAELSPLQKKKQKEMGSRYVVERVQVNPFMGYRGNNIANKDTANFNQSIKPYKEIKSSSSSNKIFSNPTTKKKVNKIKTTKEKSTSSKGVKWLIGNSDKPTKRKSTARKSTKSRSISDIIFGSSKPKKTSTTKRKSTAKKSTIRKKPKSFSNADSLWGNTDSNKPVRKSTKRKSTTKKSTSKKSKGSSNMDWFFGSSSSKSSGKKSSGSSNVDSIWGGSSSSKPTKRKSRKKSSGSSNVDKIWGSGSGKSFKL